MRARKYLVGQLFLSVCFVFLFAGCSTKVGDSITIPMGELAMHDAIPKAKSIAKLEIHIQDAKNDNMPFLVPHYFQEASDILKEAQSSPDNVSSDDLAKADAILAKAEVVSALVKKTFTKELELKTLLDKYTANKIYPWEYEINIYELSKLIERVELDRGGNIEKSKAELNKSMQALYNKIIQNTSLGELNTINKDAEK
jgi:hypothetical protein